MKDMMLSFDTGMSEQDLIESLDIPPEEITFWDEDYPREETLADTDRLGFSDLTQEGWSDLCNPSPDLYSLPFEQW